MKLVPAIVSLAVSLPVLAQTDVQWTNAAGGSFFDGSNWSGGAVPSALQNPRFTLPGMYTVTGAQPWEVLELSVLQGDVTLAIFGETGVRANRMMIGTVEGERTIVRCPATPWRTSSPGAIRLRNADFFSSGLQAFGLQVLNGSTATITGNVYDANMSVYVDHDSLLRCEGATLFWANNLESSGRLEIIDSVLSLNALTQTGGSIYAINSTISGEGVSANGGVYTFIDSVLRSPCCARTLYVSGEITFQGSQAAPDGLVSLQSGRVSLLQGATSAWSVQLMGSSTLYVGPASAVVSVWAQGESVVRVSGQGTIGSSLAPGNRLLIGELGTVQFELDALTLPTAAPVLARDAAGSLMITVEHPNALQLGQQVPLFARDLSAGVFSAVELPTLHGGRSLQLVYEPTHISLLVVPDATHPCWTADFDGDGDTGTDADIEAFFACLAGNCCPACARADFDGDGSSGTDADIEAFFRVLAGAPC